MSNPYFSFRQFTVHHDRCAMKVGTDGVLLGAWADGGARVLDVGTGTGLVALMMAQRYVDARVYAIDIETDACLQARENVAASPFADRINVDEVPLQDYEADAPFDAIVCNPPFYADALRCPDSRRTLARHADTLSVADLMRHAVRLLAPEGSLSVVIPEQRRADFEREALFAGLFPKRAVLLRTVPRKPVQRCLLAFSRCKPQDMEMAEACLMDASGKRSAWYDALTRDFYLW